MVDLLLVLPLLTGYYNTNPLLFYWALVPYLASVVLVVALLLRPQTNLENTDLAESAPSRSGWEGKSWIIRFNSIPRYLVYGFAISALLLFVVIESLVESSYPSVVPLHVLDYLGAAYIITLSIASIAGLSRIVLRALPVLRNVLEERKYSFLAIGFAVSFCLIYLLLVNQIVISGYNTQGTAPSFLGYPSWFAMSPAVNNFFIYLVYLPTLIVQISPTVSLIVIPFEVVFATLLSLLVASTVVMAHYLIFRSGLSCSTRGTAMSTGGSILGLTASCPTCLFPTFVSVLFGGVSATVISFSNLYGVVLPPVLSVAILILSAWYLQKTIRNRT